jgi:hypothetical protein
LATGPHVCYRFGKMGGKLMQVKITRWRTDEKLIKLVLKTIEPLKFELDSIANL